MSEIVAARPPAPPQVAREERPLPAPPSAPPADQPAEDPSRRVEQLERAAQPAFADSQGKLSIRYDDRIGRFVYRELNPATGEVLREFPPEEVLDRLARLKSFAGASVDRKA
jgi:uncharacterized FlaG/YvyC family protein